ncbi:MAG TPA: hypothetical protein VJB61_13920, partial [Actinomycetota bacterium]
MTSADAISGVLLGGLVTEVAGWRWVFLMVVPSALAAALAALPGVAGLVLLAGFVAWERRARRRCCARGILSIRSLRVATLGAAANSGSSTDVLPALLVFGVSAAVGFVILTGQAVADVGPDERGVASGVFATANHPGGGAAAVALCATVTALVAGEGAAGPEALARGYGPPSWPRPGWPSSGPPEPGSSTATPPPAAARRLLNKGCGSRDEGGCGCHGYGGGDRVRLGPVVRVDPGGVRGKDPA